MKTYVVTYVVEVPEEAYESWSEGSDIPISLMNIVEKGDGHFVAYKEVENHSQNKYAIFDEFGGI